jgi:hypothetical protein
MLDQGFSYKPPPCLNINCPRGLTEKQQTTGVTSFLLYLPEIIL